VCRDRQRNGRPPYVTITDILRQRLGIELRDLAGAHVSGEIPLSEDLANRLIAERISQHPQVAGAIVHAQEDDAVEIQVVPRMRLLPPLTIRMHVERQPEFPHHPTLLLRWSMPAAGPLARLAAPVVSYFKTLPPGIVMEGDHIAVDLGELLASRGMAEVIGLIRRLEVHTRPGGFVARFELGV